MSPMPMTSYTFAPKAASSLRRKLSSPPPGSPATMMRFSESVL